MQASCGGQIRLVRSDIPDHDMFDPAGRTPETASRTMTLLARLDKAAGAGVMEKPCFLNRIINRHRKPR